MVMDVFGKEVLRTHTFETVSKIDLSQQSNGIYYILIRNKSKTYTSKVLVDS